MSKMRMHGSQLDKQSTIAGIGGLALLVVGLIIHQTWMGLLGISMTMIGVRGQERGLWAGGCGIVLIMFGLVFSEPLRTIIGCTFFLVGILVWHAGRVQDA